MDKYQKFMFKDTEMQIEYPGKKPINLDISDEDTIVVKQDSDISITKYPIRIKGLFIDKLWTEINGKKYEQSFEIEEYAPKKLQFKVFNIIIDFENKVDVIKFQFEKDFADIYSLRINYIDADKNAYFAKREVERKNALLEKISLSHRTGESLINIYFQPCCENYYRTEIELYTATGKWSEHPRVMGLGEIFRPALLSATVGSLMGKFKVDEGMFFKSITGLARGAYGFVLIQYTQSGEVLIKTDFVYFAIS